MLFQVVKRSVQ